MNKENLEIIGKYSDTIFVYSPFWFPIFYLALIVNIPQISSFIFIAALFIFAETHFATTFLFLFDKSNLNWAKKNFYEFFIQPFSLIILFIFFWNINPIVVLILHYLASGWHVTKQSIGITKLAKNKRKTNFYLIYFVSFSCLIVGLINPGILVLEISRLYLNVILISFFIFYLLGIYFSSKPTINFINKNNLSILTGVTIYLPLLFFKDIAVALAIGVGMHWVQYLGLTLTTNGRRLFSLNKNNFKIKNSKLIYITLFILVYSLLMTSFTMIGIKEVADKSSKLNYLYLIPILFQFYHFYIDRYLWKFSDQHIKMNVLPYIFKKNNF